MKKLLIAFMTVVTLFSYSAVSAQGENAKKQKPSAQERAQKLTNRMNKQLGLSGGRQYQEVYAINLRAAEKKVALESQLGNDKKQLGIKKREVENQRDAELRSALTPEQFAKWTHMKEEKKQKMKEKKGKGNGNGQAKGHGKGKGKGKKEESNSGSDEVETSTPAPVPAPTTQPQQKPIPVPVGTTTLPAPGTNGGPATHPTPRPVGTTTLPTPGSTTPTQPSGSGNPTGGRGLTDDGTNGVDMSEVDIMEVE